MTGQPCYTVSAAQGLLHRMLTWLAHYTAALLRPCQNAPPSDGYKYTGSYLTVLYFLVVATLGSYVIMTLFIVILLERFADQDDGEHD